jgi:hypothetical protein
MNDSVKIRWDYEGKTDIVNGTGAYFEEKLIAFIGSAIIPIVLIFQVISGRLQWNPIQIVLALIIGFDIGGGMVSNALNSCKRFYETPLKVDEDKTAKYAKDCRIFIGLHIHPIVVGLLYNNMDWFYALVWYAVFMTSVLIVYKVPLYLKRPVSVLLTLIAIVLNIYVIESVIGFEWFIPMLFIKIVCGHLIREEPYDKVTI